jgi:hypothetical protein
MTAQKTDDAGVGRRGFLGVLAGLSAGAAAMVAGSAVPVQAQNSREERVKARYQETEHVQRFYETNRY